MNKINKDHNLEGYCYNCMVGAGINNVSSEECRCPCHSAPHPKGKKIEKLMMDKLLDDTFKANGSPLSGDVWEIVVNQTYVAKINEIIDWINSQV